MPSKGNWNAGGFGFVVAHLVDKLSNLQIYKNKDRRREEREWGMESWGSEQNAWKTPICANFQIM